MGVAMLTIHPFSQQDLPEVREDIKEVYRWAFAGLPFNETEVDVDGFAYTLEQHARRAGFRGLIAYNGDGALIGFAYGYTGHPGQWWYETVAASMSPDQIKRWLPDYFEFVELAVHPDAQGQGTGGQLHDRLLAGLPHATAALSTRQAETRALALYRRRGWVTLLENFHFPGNLDRWLIMGKDLHSNS
jgi:ribosomal protein S18 acetylase RimI-like enzyme